MFKSIIEGFTGLRNIITNISQIALVVILIPFVAIIINGINGATGGGGTEFGEYIIALIVKIPTFEEIAKLLLQTSGNFSVSALPTITTWTFLQAFPEAVLVSVCVHFFDQVMAKGRDKKSKPLPIFAPFMGISVATIIINLLKLFQNVLVVVLLEVIIIIGIILAVKSLFIGGKKEKEKKSTGIFSLGRILVFVINALHGIIAACYAVAVFLVCSGGITGFGKIVGFLLPLSILIVVASVIVWFVNKKTEKEYT